MSMPTAKVLPAAVLALALMAGAAPASAQDCLLGELKLFAGNYAPRGYAFAHGQQLSIAQYAALFSLVGTTYGGDGYSNFALPDLRGRVPIGAGMGPGLNHVNLGQKSGYEWTQPRQGEAAAGYGAAVGLPVQMTNMQPSTGINYIVCTQGVFPSQ
jgi:microcystin-dependent protein